VEAAPPKWSCHPLGLVAQVLNDPAKLVGDDVIPGAAVLIPSESMPDGRVLSCPGLVHLPGELGVQLARPPRGPVSAASDLVCLFYEACKGLIELIGKGDPKLMDIEALCVGRNPTEPFVPYFSL
jgi:hypothetical protein